LFGGIVVGDDLAFLGLAPIVVGNRHAIGVMQLAISAGPLKRSHIQQKASRPRMA